MQKLVDLAKGFAGIALMFSALAPSISSQNASTSQLYSSMTTKDRTAFVASNIEEIVGIGPAGTPGAEAIEAVMLQIDAYVKRKPSRSTSGCQMGADLNTIFRRARPHVPTITTSFAMPAVQSDIGVYIAWVESEFCPCIQSPIGSLGMFQFATATARNYGINAVRGASPAKPDERCDVKAASRGAAIYLSKLLKTDFADDPQEILLAVAAYNLGEGGLRWLRREAREALKRQDVGFWELSDFVLNKRADWESAKRRAPTGDPETDAEVTLAEFPSAFRNETFRYVPKFLAAAVIGRNPRVFGIKAEPLTKAN